METQMEQPSGDSAVVETTPADTSVDTPDNSNTEVIESDLDGEPGQQPTPDEIEEELEGIKLRGKKDDIERIRNERLMHKDYTQKTQATAEDRRSLEAERAQFKETAQSHQQHLREVAQVVAIEDRLNQFSQVNWAAWSDADPVAAQKGHIEFTQLQARRGQLVNAITQKQQQQQWVQQQETATLTQKAHAVVEREIKDWSPEKNKALESYAREQGINTQDLSRFLLSNPSVMKLIDKSAKWDQLAKQRTAKTPQAAPAPPVTRVSGTGAVTTKEPSQMSDKEFATWRRRQIAQRS